MLIRSIRNAICIAGLIVFLLACQAEPPMAPQPATGAIVLSLDLSKADRIDPDNRIVQYMPQPKNNLSKSVATIHSGQLWITAADMDTLFGSLQIDFENQRAAATLGDIPAGNDRELRAELYDLSGRLRYYGQTRCAVRVGRVSNITLEMNAASWPRIEVEPDRLDFYAVPLGKSVYDTLIIRNTGNAKISVKALTLKNNQAGVFTLKESTVKFVLEPNAERAIIVGFTPADMIDYTALLDISSDDPDKDIVKVFLKGTGILPSDAMVPHLYDGVPASFYQAQFVENFDNNGNGWTNKSTDDFEAFVRNGLFDIKNKHADYGWLFWQKLGNFDEKNDFEIETKIKIVQADNPQSGNGVFWGLNSADGLDYFGYMCTRDAYYIYDEQPDDFEWWIERIHSSSVVNNIGQYNVFTIRKVENEYYFFMNSHSIGNHDFKSFYDKRIGFYVSSGCALQVDYLKVYYLSESTSYQKLDLNSASGSAESNVKENGRYFNSK